MNQRVIIFKMQKHGAKTLFTLSTGTCLLILLLFGAGCDQSEGPDKLQAEYFWCGAVDEQSVRVTARFSGEGEVRLVMTRDSLNYHGAEYSDYQSMDDAAEGYLTFTIDSLSPGTRYYYTFEDRDSGKLSGKSGSFKTFQSGPFSYTLAFSACGETASSRKVYRTIQKEDPLFYLVTGDLFYGDIATDCRHQFEQYYDSTLRSPAQSALYRTTPVAYMWDDHDFGPGNSGADADCKEDAKRAYTRYVPHYPLGFDSDTMPLSQSFTVGRVKFLLTDLRSEKRKPQYKDCQFVEGSSNFGFSEHMNWFRQELITAKQEGLLAVWVSGIPFINYPGGPNYDCDEDDDWGGYQQEREDIIRFIEKENINLCILSGDAHMVAIDDGTHSALPHSDTLRIPVFHAASLDRDGSYKGGQYSHGYHPGGGQYGIMKVIDNGGNEICVEWIAKNENNEVVVNSEGVPIQYKFCSSLISVN